MAGPPWGCWGTVGHRETLWRTKKVGLVLPAKLSTPEGLCLGWESPLHYGTQTHKIKELKGSQMGRDGPIKGWGREAIWE